MEFEDRITEGYGQTKLFGKVHVYAGCFPHIPCWKGWRSFDPSHREKILVECRKKSIAAWRLVYTLMFMIGGKSGSRKKACRCYRRSQHIKPKWKKSSCNISDALFPGGIYGRSESIFCFAFGRRGKCFPLFSHSTISFCVAVKQEMFGEKTLIPHHVLRIEKSLPLLLLMIPLVPVYQIFTSEANRRIIRPAQHPTTQECSNGQR